MSNHRRTPQKATRLELLERGSGPLGLRSRRLIAWPRLAVLLILLVSCAGNQTGADQASVIVVPDAYRPAGWISSGDQLLVISAIGSSSLPFFIAIEGSSFQLAESTWDFSGIHQSCLGISPDGAAVLYLVDQSPPGQYTGEDLYRTDISGQTVVLLTGVTVYGCPAWAPDSEQFAIVLEEEKEEGYEYRVSLMSREGQVGQDLLAGLPEPVDDLAWSPDGQTMAYVEYRTERLKTLSLDKTKYATVAAGHDEWIGASSPTWSPNGQYIAYIEEPFMTQFGGGHLVVIRSDGSDKQYLLRLEDEDGEEGAPIVGYLYSNPLWSPRGDYIAVSRLRSGQEYGIPPYEMVLVPVPDQFQP
jgi:hypothetical protein